MSRATELVPDPDCDLCGHGSGIVRLHYSNGWVGVVCKIHLDAWLDFADDLPEFEPTQLEFL